MNSMIEINDVSMWYGQFAVLTECSTRSRRRGGRVGMVFQRFELFPHLSVTENLVLAQVQVLKRSRAEAVERGLRIKTTAPSQTSPPPTKGNT